MLTPPNTRGPEYKDRGYFLSDHGTLTEVGHAVFIYSKMHVYSLAVTHPLAILGAAAMVDWRRFKRS